MNPCIVFDLETAPDPKLWGDPAFCAELRDGIQAPSNYKDPLKIAASIDEKFDAMRDKAALSWCHGKIRAIGWGLLDSDHEPLAVASEDEAEVVGTFVDAALREQVLVGGFNIRGFDVPYLTMRAAVCGIELPIWWPTIRSWDRIIDPVDIFGREGRLADYLRALGLPPKTADGSEAPSMTLEDLHAYVTNDVHVERLLIERLAKRFPALYRAS